MQSGRLKNELLSLKSQLDKLESEHNENLDNNTKEVKEKLYSNSEEKLLHLLNDRIIKLNIGGKIFKTKASTLASFPNSKFALALNQLPQNDDEIFFDRSFNNFKIILEFLRNRKVKDLKANQKLNRYEKDDLIEEINFYGLEDVIQVPKRCDYDINWDMGLSKAGACNLNREDNKILNIHSTGCYTYFVTDKIWRDENFAAEFEFDVVQTDSYLYFGIINSEFNTSSSCMCCNPSNCVYVQCDGSIKVQSVSTLYNQFSWGSTKVTLGIRVNLLEKKVYFYIPDKTEAGPFDLVGNSFRLVAGHCNTGNGSITILSCYEI